LFTTLQQLIQKYVGIDFIISQILERMGDVSRIFLVGDYAKGIDSGVIEVIIEGPALNQNYIENITQRIKKEIKKEVIVYSTAEYVGDGLLVFDNK
jgi:hypothetical protein